MIQYNVLWLDDEPEKMSVFVRECKMEGLLLHNYKTRQEGRLAFSRDFDKWDAVLLDADMPEDEMNQVKGTKGFIGMLEFVNQHSAERSVPLFISTGKDYIQDNPLLRERDDFYIKGPDIQDSEGKVLKKGDESLMHDMLEKLSSTNRHKIKSIYSDFFDSLKRMDMDSACSSSFLTILEAMHFPSENAQFNAVLYYNQLRKNIEILFRYCCANGILPQKCLGDHGNVNLIMSSIYLAGKDCSNIGIRYGNKGDRIIPVYIENIIHSILDLGNIHSHSKDLTEADLATVENIVGSAKSKLLVFGLTIQLMDVFIWFDNFINKVQKGEVELKEVKVLVKFPKDPQVPERDVDGFWHIGEFSIRLRPWDKTRIKITEAKINSFERTKEKYPYEVTDYKID